MRAVKGLPRGPLWRAMGPHGVGFRGNARGVRLNLSIMAARHYRLQVFVNV